MKLSRLLALVAVLGVVVTLPDCTDNENPKFPKVPDNGVGNEEIAPAQPAQPHTNINPQPKITECSKKVASATSTCSVTSTGTAGKILRGTVLGADEVFHNGEILFDDAGIIQCIGCDCSSHAGYSAASVVSCADGVISPGLINPHEHLTYQNNKPIGHEKIRYGNRSDWGGARGNKRLDYNSGANQMVQAFGEIRFLMSGTTSIAGGGGTSGLLRNLDTQADELEGLPATIVDSDVFPIGPPSQNIPSGCGYDPRKTKNSIVPLDGYLPHISEGIDSEAHNEFVCTSADDEFNLVSRQVGIIHAVALNAGDASLIQKGMAKVVWSPRSNVDLYGNTAQAVMLDIAGVMIALGSDWVPSGSMNMLRELRCADEWNQKYFDKHFTDADLWRMATTNAAYSIGVGYATGLLKEGYVADVAVYDGKKSKDFRAVLDAGVEDVSLVLRGGRAMYGDDELIRSTIWGDRAGCDTFAGGVCGKEKAVCIDVRFNKPSTTARPTLADLRTAGEQYYPLFFCKDQAPSEEPTCVPSREAGGAVYTGIPTATDSDGDGVPDARDNCPKVFNPIRPMDQGRQADADNDGIGDACDECPNDKNRECARATSGDLDGDGVPNGLDNCPEIANPKQEDADSDGRGDACDACPNTPNPGAEPCPFPIATLRNRDESDHPKFKANVAIDGYISAKHTTTAHSNDFFYVQHATTGAPWQGVYVLAGALAGTASTGPAVGEKVRIVGRYSDRSQVKGFFVDVDGITAANVVVNGPQQVMTPLAVSASQINTAAGKAAEPYESLLLSVGDVTIANDNPDTGQFFEFVVTGDLRIGDFIWNRHGTLAPTNEDCKLVPLPAKCEYPRCALRNGRAFTNMVGVLGYSFGNRKLYPRGTSANTTGLCAGGGECPDYAPAYDPNPCN
jgi:cytosine/adenosine deaminase-related metal-dependent hydrolase